MKHVAYVIGINNYSQGISNLVTAENDATVIAKLLAEKYRYDVKLETGNFTKAQFARLLAEIDKPKTEQEAVLFYFAGHGIALDNEKGMMRGYLVPSDANPGDQDSFVEMEALQEALKARNPHHLLVVLDCCFAGAFRWSGRTRGMWLEPKTDLSLQKYRYFQENSAWQVITSASYDQKAIDLLSGNRARDSKQVQEHSPFAWALLEGLGLNAQPLDPQVITAHKLVGHLQDRFLEIMAEEAQVQFPQSWPIEGHTKGQFYFQLQENPQLAPAPELSRDNSPWRGLKPYKEKDANLFFGRETEIKRLRDFVEAHPVTVVTGASGSGKSSLVMAGLLPRLRETVTEQADAEHSKNTLSWKILPIFQPGEDPKAALHDVLKEGLPEMLGNRDRLLSFQDMRTWLTAHPDQRLLLVLNQFEELVTYSKTRTGEEDSQQTLFMKELGNFVQQGLDRIHLVVTLRSDFEPQFEVLTPSMYSPKNETIFRVARMSYQDLQDVVELPAAASSIFFEPVELVDRLVNEVAEFPSALPLLSFTLDALFLAMVNRGDGSRKILLQDYIHLGGVIGSIQRSADEVYESLQQGAEQTTMCNILLRMVSLEGGQTTRRRVLESELQFADGDENKRVEAVLAKLVDARLIYTGDDENKRHFYAPAHEELIRSWARLSAWIRKAGQEELLLMRSLTESVENWEEGGRKNGLLWTRDPRLDRALELAGRSTPSLWKRVWPFGKH